MIIQRIIVHPLKINSSIVTSVTFVSIQTSYKTITLTHILFRIDWIKNIEMPFRVAASILAMIYKGRFIDGITLDVIRASQRQPMFET